MGKEIATIDTSGYPAIGGENAERLMKVREKNLGMKMEEGDFPRIKLPKQGDLSFTIPGAEGDVLEKSLKGIIVYHSERKAYWEQSFEETDTTGPPDCFSNDGEIGRGNPGGSCEGCPHNQWGSSGKGNGKACSDFTLIFMLRPDMFMPDLIRIPPTSVKAVRQFFVSLFSKGILYYEVEVEITAAKDKAGNGMAISTFNLRATGKLPEDQIDRIESYHEGIEKAAAKVNTVAESGNTIPEEDVPF